MELVHHCLASPLACLDAQTASRKTGHATSDQREAVDTFIAKRTPVFRTGRCRS